jgi:hypothetical protein
MNVLFEDDNDFPPFHSLGEKKVINLKEASRYSGIPLSTLYKYSCKKLFPFSKPTGKGIFIETSEFIKFLLQNPQKTANQLENEALNLSKRKPKK